MRWLRSSGIVATLLLGASGLAQLRVATYNITSYNGGRATDLANAFFASFEGRSMRPDILLAQEFFSDIALAQFVQILNSAPGSPGDYAAAPFFAGGDTGTVMVYRTSKVDWVESRVVAQAGTGQPRNTVRHVIRPKGYAAPSATLALYNAHFKAGTASTDLQQRLTEATRIRNDANGLPQPWHFLLGADLNMRSSGESAYQQLVGSQANNRGRFFDPIATPGSWNNNFAFRFVHTQDPVGPGGMDDRFDQILVSANLFDGRGFEYIGNPSIPYSTTTWNDPNHSYRAWGNDGTSFDTTLRVQGNTMVGPTIAQSLINLANGAGHIPVFLDLRVPPRAGVSTMVIDFGRVLRGSQQVRTLSVGNAGDVELWTENGISPLNYTLTTTGRFATPFGFYQDPAGGGFNVHEVFLDTSLPGRWQGTLVIESDSPEEPVILVTLRAHVVDLGLGIGTKIERSR